MQTPDIIQDLSQSESTFLACLLTNHLQRSHAGKKILPVDAWEFCFEDFAEDGQCEAKIDPSKSEFANWSWSGNALVANTEIGFWDVSWAESKLQIARIYWETPCGRKKRQHWVISDDLETSKGFVEAVCRWADQLREVILTFSDGYWHRSGKLFQAIQNTNLDSLVLRGDLKSKIIEDFERFLDSREKYRSFGSPWKRGVLLTGPPGNGKTHFIRGLVRHLEIPCFYVKSFETQNRFRSTGIQTVFSTVRRTTPSILILEDLDTLINDTNRSYFLNELDGFESNEGIITIATTNHPENLDPAIIDRPSRFDQKWAFELPGFEERLSYLTTWNSSLPTESTLGDVDLRTIAERTNRFSFAFLKELCLGSVLTSLKESQGQPFVDTILAYMELLIAQSPNLRSDQASLKQ